MKRFRIFETYELALWQSAFFFLLSSEKLFSQNGIKRKTIANKNGELWQLIYHRMSYLPIVSKLDFKHQKVTKSIRVCTVLLKCIDQGFILAIEKHSLWVFKNQFCSIQKLQRNYRFAIFKFWDESFDWKTS